MANIVCSLQRKCCSFILVDTLSTLTVVSLHVVVVTSTHVEPVVVLRHVTLTTSTDDVQWNLFKQKKCLDKCDYCNAPTQNTFHVTNTERFDVEIV